MNPGRPVIMNYVIVAFHTPEYADCVPGFITAGNLAGCRVVIQPMNSRADWALNTGLKPLALLRLRERLAGPLLYLDVDTVVLSAPELPPGAWDLAMTENPVVKHRNRLSAAAFFLADTPAVRDFLLMWRAYTRQTRRADHPLLTRALRDFGAQLQVAPADFAGRLRINGFRPARTQAAF
jgi:hypothetical protein